jgi:hypothetical protein
MESINRQRCFHHSGREAVARCPECTRFFCRECVAEYEDRVLCSSCLKKISAPVVKRSHNFKFIGRVLPLCFGLVVGWLFFYFVGKILITIPAQFHDGKIWEQMMEGNP